MAFQPEEKMMILRTLAISLQFLLIGQIFAENWPGFRGPLSNGKSSEKNLPLKWSSSENVLWKIKLPGPGSSSPIIWNDKVFLSQSVDKAGKERALLCLDRKNGNVLWSKTVRFDGKEPTHATNPYCSATPATDGERVVVSFGSAGVYCFDMDGNELWKKDFGPIIHIWGNASSPVLFGNYVYLNIGPGKETFLVALDKKTGRELWRTTEPGGSSSLEKGEPWIGSWSTPVVANLQGKSQLLMSWPEQVKSYDPEIGTLNWVCSGLTKLVYTSPLVEGNIMVAMSGYHGSALATLTDGKENVTTTHRLWHNTAKAPQRIGSGIIHDGKIFMANAGPGIIQCMDLKTGKDLWENQRLGANHWGSMVYSDGKLYSTDQNGDTYILEASSTFKLLGKNSIGEHVDASLAISQGCIFIRSFQHLWCIADSTKN